MIPEKEFKETIDALSDDKDLLVELTVALKVLTVTLEDIVECRKQLNSSDLPAEELSKENEKLNIEEAEAETEFNEVQKRLLKSSIARKKAEIERLTKEKDRLFCGHKVYPNDPCPCGSGKKYKKCCGRPPKVGDKT